MTHLTPTSLLFFSIAVLVSYIYFWWHIWYYDRFASIFPTRRQAFKCIITWWYLATHMLYGTFASALAYIKYSVGYQNVPGYGTIPTPFARWPTRFQKITPPLYYVLAAALVIHVSTQIEETCYWIQLARSIRGRTTKSWLSSVWFVIWLLGTIGAGMTFYGVTIPYEDDPQHMETNLLFTASIWTIVATAASFYVVFKFPQLIQSVRGQGGSQEVLMRLSYHRRLTKYRIYGRLTFCVPFLVITIDGLTESHEVAHREYLTDLFVVIGLFGLFCSSILSILIYFPPMRLFSNNKDEEVAPILSMAPLKATHVGHHIVRMTEADEARHRDHEQIKSQLSIVAPFATPPPTPKPLGREGDDEYEAESPKKAPRGLVRGPAHGGGEEYAGATISRLSSLSPPNGHRRDTRVTIGQAREESGNQYAWSMLADHLRLPQNAMGIMGMEMNEGNTKWREARRNVEQQFFPGVMTQTQRDMTIRFEDHQERLRSPRASADPYGGLDTSPEQHRPMTVSQPGQPPHLGPPLPIIQTDDSLTSSDILNSYMGQDGLPTGQSSRFHTKSTSDSSPSTNDGRGRRLSYKRKPLPVSPGSASMRHQPLGMGIGLSVEEEDERTRSLPPPLRSPPKTSILRSDEK